MLKHHPGVLPPRSCSRQSASPPARDQARRPARGHHCPCSPSLAPGWVSRSPGGQRCHVCPGPQGSLLAAPDAFARCIPDSAAKRRMVQIASKDTTSRRWKESQALPLYKPCQAIATATCQRRDGRQPGSRGSCRSEKHLCSTEGQQGQTQKSVLASS